MSALLMVSVAESPVIRVREQVRTLLFALNVIKDLPDPGPAQVIKDAIRRLVEARAYEISQERLNRTAEDDWLEAEDSTKQYWPGGNEWRINNYAYMNWRCRAQRGPLDDWLEAEKQILGRGHRLPI